MTPVAHDEVRVIVGADGIHGLWHDELRLVDVGRCHVRRISFIEFDNRNQLWTVRVRTGWLRFIWGWILGRPVGILHRAASYTEAVNWEHSYFSPGGAGWRDTGD